MSTTSQTARPRRHPRRQGGYRTLTGAVLAAIAATVISLPAAGMANAAPQCDQDVGSSIDSYLKRHPDLHQQLLNQSQAEGSGGNLVDFLNRHPDVRQHLIDLSHSCPP